jgi:uncharacterized protein YndB with AHSA1/START domain
MTDTHATTRSVVIEREMPHPPQKVWRALTQSALIEDWMLKNDFEPVVGRRFTFRAPPMPQWNGLVDGEVLEVEPSARLSYSWNVGADGPGAMRTVVTFTLSPTPAGTHVRMEQSGFRADQENNARGAEFGWKRFVEGLERVAGGLA